jgi:hypothetical protein
MPGGASKVRFVSKELQESKITVSATPPPTAHQSFSRLPWTHRVNLECSTAGSVARSSTHRLRIFTENVCRRFEAGFDLDVAAPVESYKNQTQQAA